MRRLIRYFTLLSIFLITLQASLFAEPAKTFKTKSATIFYSEEKDVNDFLWRLGGSKLEFSEDTSLASSRIDRIISRVETILDMRPRNFSVNIYLHRGLLEGPHRIAFYEHKTKSIHVSVEYATDGVFAHEVAHAVINQYFASTAPPSKVQEILTQYVDKYLWSDY